jgi:glycosyltransferase involved in cell wall biosynthesis
MKIPMRSNGNIRVLHLGSPIGLYGAEHWILALIRHLDPSIFDSTISVIKDNPSQTADLCAQVDALGFRTHIFESYGKFSFSAIGQIRNFIKLNDIHIVHSHGYKTDMIGLLAVKGTRCKIIATPHGWSKNAGIKLRLYEILDRCAFTFFDKVIPLSEELYKGLQCIPGLNRKLYFIENGVDIDEIDSVTKISNDIQDWKARDYFVIGYIGQLIYRKGIDILLRAFAEIDIPHLRLAIVGKGEKRAQLEKIARSLNIIERVRFFGYREDRISILKGFDAFILPSRLEGIPRCLMEALVAGVPAIAADIPGCRELVVHNLTGLTFKVDDTWELAARIGELVKKNDKGKHLALAGRSLIIERFSANVMADKYGKLYQSLLRTI